jgi:hypothetical protein
MGVGRVLLGLLLASASCVSQTTQGLIAGTVINQVTNRPIDGALVKCEQAETNTRVESHTGPGGNFYLPLLSPGLYHIRASVNGYQAKEIYDVLLSVGGYAFIEFKLRPLSDVWERGRYGSEVFQSNTVLPFFGPDVDASYVGTFEAEHFAPGQLEPSISDVIDPRAIATLPLAGRDIFSTLALLPGVTTDSSSDRSLGLSANGQRPSSSNFLLDGVEENDQLLSGPAVRLAPEMIQEYRVSTNNFSAEYGGTSGYIANAITRSASQQWHGIGYGDLSNDRLDANTFQHNATGIRRTTSHEIESGISGGGAIPKSRLLSWTAIDYFGSRSYADPSTYYLPTEAFAQSLPAGPSATLLRQFPPVQWAPPSAAGYGPVSLAAPVTLSRKSMLERLDDPITRRHRAMIRGLAETLRRPDFNWSPYGEAPYNEEHFGVVAAVTSTWSSTLVSELRAGYHEDSRGWDLALPQLPVLGGFGNLELPGSCCGFNGKIGEGWRERTGTTEVAGNLAFSLGPHLLKIGAGELETRLQTRFVIPAILSFSFNSPADFAADNPRTFDLLLSNLSLGRDMNVPLDTDRAYRYGQQYAFVQEDWRVSRRLTLNAGLRYDRFPSPVNIGSVPDVLIQPSPGTTLEDQNEAFSFASHSGSLYRARPNAVAARLGASLLLSSAGTVLRGGFGTFHDRLAENVWIGASANDLSDQVFGSPCAPATYRSGQYSTPVLDQGCAGGVGNVERYDLTAFDPKIKVPLVESFFVSLQQPIGRNLAVELNGLASRGSRLLTTDVLNRDLADSSPVIDYRTNQGFSRYTAGSAQVRYRTGRATVSASWTWSHSIDNQSDPLLGEYFDLGFSNQTDRTRLQYFGSFSIPGDTRGDRGNSDFDQRQNFIGWASFELPDPRRTRFAPLFRHWSVAAIFAVRSGLPYSVFAGFTSCSPVCNTRANVVDPSAIFQSVPITGGVQILNPAAFAVPPDGQQGNTGRNAFAGPGFSNIDASCSRSFAVPRLGEKARLIARFDAFNFLNHANLQNPDAYLGYTFALSPTFGNALFGRTATNSGFPSLTPVIENARQVHFLLRFEF